MALKHFPERLLRSGTTPPPRLVGVAKTPGRTMSGIMPVSRSDGGGLWAFERSGIPIRNRTDEMAWNALQAHLADGARPIIVPFCHKRIMPAPIVGGARLYTLDDVPYDEDDIPHDDDTDYETEVVQAIVASSVGRRSPTLQIVMTVGDALIGGELFSIDHTVLRDRLYRIVTAELVSGVTYQCTIEPPLREAVIGSTPVQFDLPRCVMQLSGAGAMTLPLNLNRFGGGQVSFIESFLPIPD